MAAILSARERAILDYLYRQADARLIDSLPTPELRVLASVAPVNPLHVRTWKGDA